MSQLLLEMLVFAAVFIGGPFFYVNYAMRRAEDRLLNAATETASAEESPTGYASEVRVAA